MTRDVAAAIIEHVGDFADETVLVVSGFDAGFADRLESLGAVRVVSLRPNQQPERHSASLALAPRSVSLGWTSGTLGCLRDAMVANGRIICCLGEQQRARSVISLGRMLKAHGFAAIDAAHVGGHLLLSAEVPMFGPRCHV